jgi:hypothetical protein
MKKAIAIVLGLSGLLALVLAFAPRPSSTSASSHREAPLISEDPTADNTDVYAFRSPDKPSTFTIVSNWIPGEDPAAGPNYYTFSPTARYDIYIDRNGDGKPDVTYRFRFTSKTGPFFLGDTIQSYTVTRNGVVVAHGMTPPDNIGPRSTPNYHALAMKAITRLPGGGQVFAGQRQDPFFADVGAIFDLVAIRKGTGNMGGGRNFLAGYAVHTIALQLPIASVDTSSHVIGVWSATDRKGITVDGKYHPGWVQVSRLGNPLINEAVIPTGLKDHWNATNPSQDSQFVQYYKTPILAAVINKLYKLGVPTTNRNDLVAVLLTGIPKVTFTGNTLADELRLNLSVPPTSAAKANRMGVLGGDNAGYPNGRRLNDDVIDITEQAVGGFLLGHKLPLGDGVNGPYKQPLAQFPYVPDPDSGFQDVHAG